MQNYKKCHIRLPHPRSGGSQAINRIYHPLLTSNCGTMCSKHHIYIKQCP